MKLIHGAREGAVSASKFITNRDNSGCAILARKTSIKVEPCERGISLAAIVTGHECICELLPAWLNISTGPDPGTASTYSTSFPQSLPDGLECDFFARNAENLVFQVFWSKCGSDMQQSPEIGYLNGRVFVTGMLLLPPTSSSFVMENVILPLPFATLNFPFSSTAPNSGRTPWKGPSGYRIQMG
ncbi:isoflavone reductase family protein [Moniliophthora roreri]|nr:isoflavone reductase family protein [Moniliophthora roreri]